MSKREVLLTEHQDRLIEALLRSGRYVDASEILREGLRLVERREAEDAAKVDALRRAAEAGVAAIAAGDCIELATGEDIGRHVADIAERAIAETARS